MDTPLVLIRLPQPTTTCRVGPWRSDATHGVSRSSSERSPTRSPASATSRGCGGPMATSARAAAAPTPIRSRTAGCGSAVRAGIDVADSGDGPAPHPPAAHGLVLGCLSRGHLETRDLGPPARAPARPSPIRDGLDAAPQAPTGDGRCQPRAAQGRRRGRRILGGRQAGRAQGWPSDERSEGGAGSSRRRAPGHEPGAGPDGDRAERLGHDPDGLRRP